MTTVELDALAVTLSDTPILTPLSHRFAAGQWHIILGRSGVGKSTLLAAIAGLLPPAALSGRILINGKPGQRGQLALMAQHNDLLPWLNARNNILLGARLRGEPATTHDAEHWLAAIGLAGQGDKRPAQFSGGERQRLALARTLAENRALVMMDEPFSALDAVNRHLLQTLAVRLLGGKTVIMITHDPLEALRLADTLHILDRHPSRLIPFPLPPDTPPRTLDNRHFATLHQQLLERLAREPDYAH